ncbi:NAD(P)-binding protein [Xylaria sp. FL1777]|nr:NAD(P)-binding protein [Xylaria sp. FL1777]
MADRVRQEVGYIDLLVANAGMSGPGLNGITPRASAADFARSAWLVPMSDFDATYRLNCTATYYSILAFLELLEAGNKLRRPGVPRAQVVATSSMVAFQRDPRYGFAYLSSKSALISMMKSFATFGVAWGIRFNSIAAGLFPTDLSAQALVPFKIAKEKDLSEEGAFSRSFLPAERAGSKEDIAGILLYLVSKAGAYVNGSVMLVDGGKIATVPATY